MIEERSRNEDAAREESLRLAAQMGVLSRLYPGVVHDLKSPLNTLVVNLELLKASISDAPDVARQERYVGVLREELQRLNRSIESLLPAAAPPSDETGRFDLRELVEEVGGLVLAPARHQSVKLEVAPGDAPLPLDGRRGRLKQALLDVVLNALDAMPGGGSLELRAERHPHQAVVSVSDSGPGIPEEAADRVYDLYYTTKDRHSGLGLYVARAMVESANGSISHRRSAAGGTRFEFKLPLAA